MDAKRRGFFKALSTPLRGEEQTTLPIRPPYNSDSSLFHKVCTTCETKPCVGVCDEEIIIIADDGTPELDFSRRGCTYCDACAEACDKEVLMLGSQTSQINAKITLDMTKCVAWHDVICASCRDVCYDRAIKFLGILRPQINDEACTNCGFCIGVCPSYAINVSALEESI